jgi:uncharacterized protein
VHHDVVLSPFILDELERVLTGKFGFGSAEARNAMRLLQTRARTVEPQPLPKPICRDPDDDQILALAISTKCRAIVTGDRDLTDLQQVEGIRILTPTDFWRFETE